jgi:glycosyltransferase involved in cell wall biosynthesis
VTTLPHLSGADVRKLIIQIPCYNEEGTLAQTLAALPRSMPGFDVVEWLIIDDGCTDNTVEVAKRCGADHIVSLPSNQGLAKAFSAGLEASLKSGADVIVNTDADNQYDASCIGELLRPILSGEAQMVIGARPIADIADFSAIKKFLQRLGSAVVKLASGTTVPDAPSGFRAIHAEAAIRLCVFSQYTYTLETLIQAGRKNIPVTSVPISVNGATRPSRLVKSIPSYVHRSMLTIIRIFILYKPLRFFVVLGTVFLVPAVLIGVRFLVGYLSGSGGGRTQSLILAAILSVTAMVVYAAGILADLIAANRVLLEEVRMRLLKAEISANSAKTAPRRERSDQPNIKLPAA